jgi:hypothetical protein
MVLKQTEAVFLTGLEMNKCVHPGGFFTNPLYESVTAQSLEEIIELGKKGFMVGDTTFVWNLVFAMYADLSKIKE